MKKLVQVSEVEGEGFVALLGEPVMVFCSNYIYSGKLLGVNETTIQLCEASIVYETGAFSDKTYKVAEKLPSPIWYVQIASIESFGVRK